MQNKKITLFITMIFIIIIIIVAIFYNKPLSPPERIGDIPINAFWVGGSDGGLWYEFFTNNDSIYHFRIYNDFSGLKTFEGDYKVSGQCKDEIKNANLKDIISHSTNDRIYLTINDKGKLCYFEKVN